MSMDGPCTVARGGSGVRGFSSGGGGGGGSSSSGSGSVFSSREQAHPQQAVRFGFAFAPATASSATWDANEEPLPDILGPPLRSVSSLVMSIDADESMSPAARNNNSSGGTNSGTNKNTSNSSGVGGAAKDVAVSGAMGSKMVDMLMTPLPAPTNDQLTREQSFPPPFRTRLGRDQSFPPMDMLPSSSSSLRSGWSTVPTSNSTNSGGGGGSMVVGGLFAGTGGAPSLSKFQGLGFQGAPSSMPWDGADQDAPGGPVHRGGGNGGSSLGNEGGQHGVYYDLPPPSSSRQRHSSFDKLAEMIPGIPHWTTPPSPSGSAPPSTGAPVEAREMHGGGGGGTNSNSTTKTEPVDVLTPAPASRATLPARGRQPHPTSSTRLEKKIKKQHLRRADSSPPRARWSPSATSPAVEAAAITRRPPNTGGTGKRSVEPPLSCGPVQPGGGPVDLAQQERRRVKIQRYLYKRSRRKFAKSTRDASPSRSRPKAAAKRPRIKGKFVKTVPDFISVIDRHPREGAGDMDVAVADQQDAASPPSPPKSPAARGVGVGVGWEGRRGGVGGGGVRSVRNGGSVNINFNTRKAFSSTPSSSLLPRGAGGGARLPPALALAPNDGAPNAFLWQTNSMSMPM